MRNDSIHCYKVKMNTFNCLFICLLACFSIASASEIDDDVDNYVIGGRAAAVGQFTSIVSIRSSTNIHFCAGFILSDRWVVSAANCGFLLQAASPYIAVGAHRRTDGQRIRTARVILHPRYNRNTRAFDIALVQTQTRIPLNNRIQPIRWPRSANVPAGQTVRLAGWGMDHVSSNNNVIA